MASDQRQSPTTGALSDLVDEWADLRTLLARYDLPPDIRERIMLVNNALNRVQATFSEGD